MRVDLTRPLEARETGLVIAGFLVGALCFAAGFLDATLAGAFFTGITLALPLRSRTGAFTEGFDLCSSEPSAGFGGVAVNCLDARSPHSGHLARILALAMNECPLGQ